MYLAMVLSKMNAVNMVTVKALLAPLAKRGFSHYEAHQVKVKMGIRLNIEGCQGDREQRSLGSPPEHLVARRILVKVCGLAKDYHILGSPQWSILGRRDKR